MSLDAVVAAQLLRSHNLKLRLSLCLSCSSSSSRGSRRPGRRSWRACAWRACAAGVAAGVAVAVAAGARGGLGRGRRRWRCSRRRVGDAITVVDGRGGRGAARSPSRRRRRPSGRPWPSRSAQQSARVRGRRGGRGGRGGVLGTGVRAEDGGVEARAEQGDGEEPRPTCSPWIGNRSRPLERGSARIAISNRRSQNEIRC